MHPDIKSTRVIGVTGGMGCGMTTVSQMMENLGGIIISGDQIAREIMQPGKPAYENVLKAFGREILKEDETIDRVKLGEMVFSDEKKLKQLNQAVHPIWIESLKEKIEMVKKNGTHKIIIVDAAILLEKGLKSRVDKLVVVTAPIKIRRERIRERDFLDECQIDQRINAQIPVSEKTKQADFVIENTGTMEQTKDKLNQIWNELIGN